MEDDRDPCLARERTVEKLVAEDLDVEHVQGDPGINLGLALVK